MPLKEGGFCFRVESCQGVKQITTQESNMQKWEYLTQLHLFDETKKQWFWNSDQTDHEKIDHKLNKLGEEGWELVAVRASPTSVAFYHFKRPVE
jgi:hypothetical protein